MRVLLTGGAGFIGSHVADLLLYNGHEVVVMDDFSSGKRANLLNKHGEKHRDLIFFEHDVSLPLSSFGGWGPEAIVHLAAQPSLLASEEDPISDMQVNIQGTLNMIALANKYNVKRFVFASTSAAKGDYGSYFTEAHGDATHPSSPYGISKLAAEHYLQVLNKGYNSVILRFANVYGPRQLPLGENQLIARVMDHIYNKAHFEVFGDGEQMRDYIYVEDVAEAVYQALTDRYDLGGIFNVSSGLNLTVNNILELVRKVTGYSGKWKTDGDRHKVGRYTVSMPNGMMKHTFKWEPQWNMIDGLAKTATWWAAKA